MRERNVCEWHDVTNTVVLFQDLGDLPFYFAMIYAFVFILFVSP